ncbi:hypothetical protein CTheo_4003 [Ceratobasidium theobromae]|uniref:Uncharacterized protein n=1 Tax=Ceratobasidium theobromae TaxID=1582974 RepID=A0A5N5QN18_9AGAM|nr:hypothetical protein CTheo_4003 [Ceratobasidium theobromae]
MTNILQTHIREDSPVPDPVLSARQLGQRARRAREREQAHSPRRPSEHADDDGEDDGEGEPDEMPAVPPHSAAHLIPPIAVLAPAATPSRASLAQRARRERERAARLGIAPDAPKPVAAQVQPPTLTRGQLAQRARRARERVERAAKAAANPDWTPPAQDAGVSSAGEAVFAVAPPSGTAFASTVSPTTPGYGVGLGAAHVPQQLNRAQLAQRARRARERQQRLAAAAAHASAISPPSSVPPASPDQSDRTSLSPMASSTGTAPAPLAIGARFDEVFKSLTAGDNGVSRAVADAGALTSKDDKPRTTTPPTPDKSPANPS